MAASSDEADTGPRVRAIANTVVRGCWTIGMNNLPRRLPIHAFLLDVADDADDGAPGSERLVREPLSDLLPESGPHPASASWRRCC